MKSAGKRSRSAQATFGEKFTQVVFVALLIIVNLVLLWGALVFLDNGLHFVSAALFLVVFVCLVAVGVLCYHQNYRRLLALIHRKFPNLTRAKVLQIAFIAAVILGVLIRLAFLLIGYKYQPESDLSDTGFHWFFAQKLVNGIEPGVYDGGYGAFFPHLMTYSATLAGFMKIFGTGYQSILLSNLIFDLIATLAIYYLLKMWRGRAAAQIGSMIWLLNPLEIIFCGIGVSIVVTNAVLAVVLLLVFLVIKLIKSRSWLKLALVSLLLGMALSVGNAYRPIFTVLLIAIIMIFILQIIRHFADVIAPAILSLIFILISFVGVGKLIDLGYQSINPYHVAGGTGIGWNFFVGSNYDSWGRWNRSDSAIFGSKLYLGEDDNVQVNPDLVGVQSEFFNQGLERYKAMSPAQFVSHFIHKTSVLFADTSDALTWVFYEGFRIDANHPLYRFIDGCGTIALFAGIIVSLMYFIKLLTQKTHPWQPYLVFLMLSFCGLIAASLLVEVMQRYVMPLTVILTIFTACYFSLYYDKTTTQ